ncbi:unnamed protein product [Paramecium primaurelia]|uniref:Uncharacterized protein n=1 Tax=Paramecium primaurelia TaxID=5886 RepID=A0A8S1JM23_PARPR|nr:unnamed protein product [Paramecium primaurelia]
MGCTCNQRITSPYKEFDLEEIIFGRTYIYGPPSIEKPQPIQLLKFSDDDINYQQDKEFQYSPQKIHSQEQTNAYISSGDFRLMEQKLSVDEALILNEQHEQQEQNSILKEDRNSQMKDSNQDIVKYKSILKHKSTNTINTSYPQSPQNQLKESQTSNTQKSIKKVTFDKKSKVVYSSFRRIQY